MHNAPNTPGGRTVDVTVVDGHIVHEPLVATDHYDEAVAKANTARIRAIMTHPDAGEHTVFLFPSGAFYFDGAAEGAETTLATTRRFQTIMGVDAGGTRLLQKSTDVAATVGLHHSTCALRNLYIGSADADAVFHVNWEAHPHQAAILMEAPPVGNGQKWTVDAQISNVNINSGGNTILIEHYNRPFRTGIAVRGPWLNIYAHTMWITDVFTAIHIDQGPTMAGPAKFIDVNFYSSHDREHSKAWSTFFKSERHFMEQVELIHCTFIGAQFIYMDGPLPEGEPGQPTPAFDMVIDHNYVNVYDTMDASEQLEPDARWSGIYMNLPGKKMPNGSMLSTRDIRFTSNSCTGRAPIDGAFFYVEGMCRGITFADNDISCAGADRCVYIRPTMADTGVNTRAPIRDVDVSRNYFRTWWNPVTVGDAEGPLCVKRVIVAQNRNDYEGDLNHAARIGIEVHHAEQVIIEANALAETGGAGIAVQDAEEVVIQGNALRGLASDASGTGIALRNVQCAAVSGNTLSRWARAIAVEESAAVSLQGNVLRNGALGMDLRDSSNLRVSGNVIVDTEEALREEGLQDSVVDPETTR